MKMLMPANVRAVKQYRDGQPLFSRMGVESQLDAMFSPTVQLRSGGYIVINQTEALVSIDVNSGRATREHHIEDTALKTNLEAAEEVARQLRLRDLAGLIVIDFIDMDEKRNNRAVERKLSRLPAAGPRAHPGRPHLAFRPAGNVAPAHPRQRAGKLDRALPAMRRHRPCPLGLVGRAAAAARHRGNPDEGRDPQSRGAHPHRRRALCAEPQARPSAGLIVIDFIDMDEKRTTLGRTQALRLPGQDRARIQVGRISHFGLLEMSRQRIRASVLESSTEPCPQCGGTGHVRSVSSVALQLLRGIEEILMKGAPTIWWCAPATTSRSMC